MHGMSYCIIKRCVGAARVTARMIYIRLESRSTNETSAFFRGDFEQNPAAVPRNNNVGKTTLSQLGHRHMELKLIVLQPRFRLN